MLCFVGGCLADDEGEDFELPPEVALVCPDMPDLRAEAGPGFYAHYTRVEGVEDVPETITGAYADVVVNVGDAGGQLVFSRATSYRPVWRTAERVSDVAHLSAISGDCPPEQRFDLQNEWSFARVLEQGPDQIVVGWRYFPDLERRSPQDVVHETFTVRPDGSVTREHRAGSDSIVAWEDPLNRTVQELSLSAAGIEVVSTTEPSRGPAPDPVEASPDLGPVSGSPALALRFDEGFGDVTGVEGTETQARIAGQGRPWRAGVSGRALAFDGYASAVRLDAAAVPDLGEGFSLGAWVALGARPWSDTTVVGIGEGGPVLGIDPQGQPFASFGDTIVRAATPIQTRAWTHLAASFDGTILALYVDGQGVAEDDVGTGTAQGELRIGMNAVEAPASDGVRFDDTDEFHHFSSLTGLEGLVDEVVVFDRALDPTEVGAIVETHAGGGAAPPALQPRQVPDRAGQAPQFGALLEPLPFHDLWDDQWRVGTGDDVVVKFDQLPGSVVYWRGTTHGLNMVADDGSWMADQSVELIVPDIDDTPIRTLAEHMSDKQARRSHVRVIENTDARVVVHWRYAAADVFDDVLHQRAHIDETHTIYPDGVLIRKVFYHLSDLGNGLEFYQDFQVLLEPGQRAEDAVGLSAVSYANLAGETGELTWPLSGEGTPPISPANVIRINFESEWDVYGVQQGGTHYPAHGGAEISTHVDYEGAAFPFAGPWNHWPVAQIPSDGRFVTDYDRVSHFALGSAEPQEHGTGSMLYGLTRDATMDETITVARSWIQPPAITIVAGAGAASYDTDSRAYVIDDAAPGVILELAGNGEHPVHNPAFVLSRWPDQGAVSVTVDGEPAAARTGITRDTDGQRQLVVFVPTTRTDATRFRIAQ